MGPTVLEEINEKQYDEATVYLGSISSYLGVDKKGRIIRQIAGGGIATTDWDNRRIELSEQTSLQVIEVVKHIIETEIRGPDSIKWTNP